MALCEEGCKGNSRTLGEASPSQRHWGSAGLDSNLASGLCLVSELEPSWDHLSPHFRMGTIQFLSAQVVRMGGGNVFNTIQAGHGASLVVLRVKNLPAVPETQARSLDGKDPPRASQAALVVKNVPETQEV